MECGEMLHDQAQKTLPWTDFSKYYSNSTLCYCTTENAQNVSNKIPASVLRHLFIPNFLSELKYLFQFHNDSYRVHPMDTPGD